MTEWRIFAWNNVLDPDWVYRSLHLWLQSLLGAQTTSILDLRQKRTMSTASR